jgi:hypothetical protein
MKKTKSSRGEKKMLKTKRQNDKTGLGAGGRTETEEGERKREFVT